MAGIQLGEEVVDTFQDDGRTWESVEKDFSAEQFRCPVCDLFLDGLTDIESANLEVSHQETDEREMEYEPEYGNE